MSIESERMTLIRKKRYALVVEYKESNPCADCGRFFPAHVMDLDHVRGVKFRSVSKMGTYSETRLLEELAKCDLVCANCHRVRTHARFA